jgi:hypothetical protein
MDTRSIVAELDAEISKLQKARAVLARDGKVNAVISRATAKVVKRRKLSAAARARIAAAQRKRWAAVKKAAK